MCDLKDDGVLYAPTVAQAAADTERARRRVFALVDDLVQVDRDRAHTIDEAVIDLEGAITIEVSARLLETLVALNHADHLVYAAPAGGRRGTTR